MNTLQERELLDFLASLGFKGAGFELAVTEQIAGGRPVFKIDFDQEFGREKVLFDLLFVKDYQFNAYRLDHYKAIYKDDPANIDPDFRREPFRDFHVGESGFVNVNLAWHQLSGRLDELYTKMLQMGLEKFPGIDLYSYLEKQLSMNSEQFKIDYWFNHPEGFAYFHQNISSDNHRYTPGNYTLQLTPHRDITHGVFNGVDTSELAFLMEQINWKADPNLFVLSGDNKGSELEFAHPVTTVLEQMDILENDLKGREILMQLQLKYWIDTEVFNDKIAPDTWLYLKSQPTVDYTFNPDVELRTAFNLLCGRSVPENLLLSDLPDTNNWVRLDFTREHPKVNVASFSTSEFEKLAAMLPIWPADQLKLLYPLIQGSLVEATLRNNKRVLLEANPEEKTINIYTPEMQLVRTNLLMEPDWNPIGMQDHLSSQLIHEINKDQKKETQAFDEHVYQKSPIKPELKKSKFKLNDKKKNKSKGI